MVAIRPCSRIGRRSFSSVPPGVEVRAIRRGAYNPRSTRRATGGPMTVERPIGSLPRMVPMEEEDIGLRPPFLHRIRASQLQTIDFVLAALFLVATLPHLGYAGNRHGAPTGALFGLALGAALPVAI